MDLVTQSDMEIWGTSNLYSTSLSCLSELSFPSVKSHTLPMIFIPICNQDHTEADSPISFTSLKSHEYNPTSLATPNSSSSSNLLSPDTP
jgi:hypothetical protein